MDKLNSIVLTTSEITEMGRPILVVYHDNDNSGIEWQFHSDDSFLQEKIRLVSLKNILDIDKTINELNKLPAGYGASRKFAGDKWKYFKIQ